MNRIMLSWGFMLVGLVFSSSAFNTQHRHRHRHPNKDINIQYIPQEDDVVYRSPGEALPEHLGATDCNVEGVWYNGHGSEMILNVTETGLVIGEFRTAVERKTGAAGSSAGRVTGLTASPDSSHKTLSFSVLWNEGTSVTAWTGLCHVCDGLEIIKTTWILTSDAYSCSDHWSSNRIGQDDFTRFEQKPGPRRHLDIHTPSEFAATAGVPREGIVSQVRQEI